MLGHHVEVGVALQINVIGGWKILSGKLMKPEGSADRHQSFSSWVGRLPKGKLDLVIISQPLKLK